MKLQHRLLTAAAVVAAAVCAPRARALVSLEDGRDRLYVDGTVEMGYDSNVFANAQSGGSMLLEGSLGTEFARRAGLIGVDATAALSFARYANFRDQDYVDPKLTAELTKQTGRTTGSLVVSMQRENRADVDVNTRDVSWNYDVALNVQYPVIERYSISGTFDYSYADYQDQQLFTNLATYTGSLYLYYILDEQRDFFVDYRARYSAVANGSDDIDNSLSAGVNGQRLRPFQRLDPGRLPGAGVLRRRRRRATYNDLTASGSTTWNINRRMSLATDLSRDFSTTAQAQSIDSTSYRPHLQGFLHSKGQRHAAGLRWTEPVPRRRGLAGPGRIAAGRRLRKPQRIIFLHA